MIIVGYKFKDQNPQWVKNNIRYVLLVYNVRDDIQRTGLTTPVSAQCSWAANLSTPSCLILAGSKNTMKRKQAWRKNLIWFQDKAFERKRESRLPCHTDKHVSRQAASKAIKSDSPVKTTKTFFPFMAAAMKEWWQMKNFSRLVSNLWPNFWMTSGVIKCFFYRGSLVINSPKTISNIPTLLRTISWVFPMK